MTTAIAIRNQIDRSVAQQDRFEDWLILSEFIAGHDSVLDFMVFQVTGQYVDGKPSFEVADDPACNSTDFLAEAQVFLRGAIKWDGCSNWHFDEQDIGMLHFCGVGRASSIGRLMERMYDLASARMPTFDRGLADMPPLIEG